MAKVEKEVILEAPIEEVFSYVSNPHNGLEFWPSLLEVNDVKPLPNGGYSGRYVYTMSGIRFEGQGEYTEIIPNQWFVIETRGGVNSTITWTFRSRGNITRVTLTVEYKVPILLLGKLAEAIIVRMNEQEGDVIMANLQARFQTASP